MTDKSKRSIIYPFHKEGWKTMSGHLIISWLVGLTSKHLLRSLNKSLNPNVLPFDHLDMANTTNFQFYILTILET